jgi:septum formation protein
MPTTNHPPIVLASASPRRKALMAHFGLPYTVITSGIPEDVDPSVSPEEAVRWLARLKAEAVAETLTEGLVIGSDTAVVLDDVILGKPENAVDACRMLQLLRGKPHRVISGVAIFDAADGRSGMTSAVTTTVYMGQYTDTAIETYVATGEPMDKAGSYAIQGKGGTLVAGIEGCYNNVVGFPLCEVAALLEGFGVQANGHAPQPICTHPDGSPCPRVQVAR